MAEQITIQGQKYTIDQHHIWGIHPRLDEDMRKRGIADSLYMHKGQRGKIIFQVYVGTKGHYSYINRIG